MQMIEILVSLKTIQAGVFGISAAFYLATLFFAAPDIPSNQRRPFTIAVALLWLSLTLDFAVSATVGGETRYVAQGGALAPIYLLLTGRVLSIIFALKFIRASWRSWRHANIQDWTA